MRKDFPANNLKEFVAYAKANESKLNMAHAGVGSVSYIGCLLLNSAIGIKPTMVPFTGTAPAMNAILAGQVDYDLRSGAGAAAACARRHRKGAGHRRQEAKPIVAGRADVGRTGHAGVRLAPFYAVFAPKGTPKEIVDKLADSAEQGPRRGGGAKAPGESRRRDRRAGAARAEGAGRAGAQRDRAADADPEGCGSEISERHSGARAKPANERLLLRF